VTLRDLRQLAAGETLEPDICVVGAGAAGLAIASRFLGQDRRVLLVESGGLRHEPALDDLNAAECVGSVNRGIREGRPRGVGGATQLWPGQCMRLDPEDLEPRPWLGSPGWPLAHGELMPRYEAAEALLGVPARALAGDVWTLLGLEPPPFPSLETRFSAFAARPSLVRSLLPAIRRSPTVELLLRATAAPAREPGDRVERLELRSDGGAHASVRAHHYVLAAGAIENARLLLLLGGGGDAAGRYLQDHVFGRIATIESPGSRRPGRWFALHHRGRVRYYPKLALPAAERQAARIGNVLVNVVYDLPYGVEAALAIRRALRGRARPQARDVAAALRGAPAVAGVVRTRYVARRSGLGDPASPGLVAIVEQPARADSRVLLSSERDMLGMPRARVQWRLGDDERRAFELVGARLREELASAGLGWAEPEPWPADPAAWRSVVHDTFHHSGTTRMSTSIADGAVDPDCRVHDLENVWVAGASVFPSAGAANPTLTIIALALRLADRLLQERR
jgi:choline dehydrogenase-like flavoprotein